MKFGLVIGLMVLVLGGGVVFYIVGKSSKPSVPAVVVVNPSPQVKKEDVVVAKSEISLNIISPVNGAVVTASPIVVRGVTVPKAEVSVNDKDVVADASGNFSVNLTLDEGDNYVAVVAVDAEGKTANLEFKVTYEVQ